MTQAASAEYKRIPLTQLVESSTNPRKIFDSDDLKELAGSIKETGVIEPIVVRPHAKGFEIVVGARRTRASKIAGVVDIPAIIRTLNDVQVVTIQLVENLQRKNVRPLEEAAGFAQLVDKKLMGDAVLTPEQIAEKVGKSPEYVYARIKMNDLIKKGRDQLEKGELETEHGTLISRLDPTDQERALKFCADHKEEYDEKVTVKDLREWIKVDVRMAKAREIATEKMNLLRGGGKKAVLISTCGKYWSEAHYLPLGTVFKDDYTVAGDKTCENIVEGVYADKANAGKVVTICTKNNCKIHHPSVSTRRETATPDSKPSKARKAAQKERERKSAMMRKAKEVAEDRAMALIVDKTKGDKQDLQLLVQVLAQEVHYNTTDGISRRHGVGGNGYRSTIGKALVAKAKTPAELWKRIFELAICNSHLFDNRYSDEMRRLQAAVYKRYGVDPDALRKAALAELRAAEEKKAPQKPVVQTSTKPKPKASKAKPAKKKPAKKKPAKKAKRRG